MTPKQEERLRQKIADIKRALAADKRQWGGQYHDGRGLRYSPPQYYLQLEDYKGAITYYRWFEKHFPDDSCYGLFFFEWALALFKTGKAKEAEKKILKCFMGNIYLLDTFLEKPLVLVPELQASAWSLKSLERGVGYAKSSGALKDFGEWLEAFVVSDRFFKVANEFIDIERKLLTEPAGKLRSALVSRLGSLLDGNAEGEAKG
jgi:hypothetical protein